MNGTHVPRQLPLLAICALAFAALPASPVRAAIITWDAPSIISASTNVSTTGSLLYAYNFGADAGTSAGASGRAGSDQTELAAVPSVTVNGVTFASFPVPHLGLATVTVGSVSLDVGGGSRFYTTNDLTGSNTGSFSILIPVYQDLLRSGVSTSNFNGTMTLTLGGLTNGQSYLVEFWTNNSGSLLTFATAGTTYTDTAANAVTLDDNNTGANGGVGRWVTGSFTADATTTQLITLQSSVSNDYPVINALQVRTVPEPSSALLLLSGAALCLHRRTVRNATNPA